MNFCMWNVFSETLWRHIKTWFSSVNGISEFCYCFSELLLQEIDHLLRSTVPGSCTIPLLCSIKQEITVIQPLLLSRDPLRVQTAVRLLGKIYICVFLHFYCIIIMPLIGKIFLFV
jgi:hypothetical protein